MMVMVTPRIENCATTDIANYHDISPGPGPRRSTVPVCALWQASSFFNLKILATTVVALLAAAPAGVLGIGNPVTTPTSEMNALGDIKTALGSGAPSSWDSGYDPCTGVPNPAGGLADSAKQWEGVTCILGAGTDTHINHVNLANLGLSTTGGGLTGASILALPYLELLLLTGNPGVTFATGTDLSTHTALQGLGVRTNLKLSGKEVSLVTMAHKERQKFLPALWSLVLSQLSGCTAITGQLFKLPNDLKELDISFTGVMSLSNVPEALFGFSARGAPLSAVPSPLPAAVLE
jgi:hypothetical protein